MGIAAKERMGISFCFSKLMVAAHTGQRKDGYAVWHWKSLWVEELWNEAGFSGSAFW